MKLNLINSNVKIGEKGSFDLYALNSYDFSENLEFPFKKGVYVFTNRQVLDNGTVSHTILYVGQTTDLSTRFQNHHKAEELKNGNPNCLAVHKCDTVAELSQWETDLICFWNPKYNIQRPKQE